MPAASSARSCSATSAWVNNVQNVLQRFRTIGNYENVGGIIGPVTANLVRSNVSHSSGQYYFEMTVVAAAVLTAVGVGVDNGAEPLVRPGGGVGGICWVGNGGVSYNGANNAFVIAPFSVNSVLGVAVDIGNKLIWFRNNGGNWNNNASANPVTGSQVGGISIAAVTPNVFALAQLTNQNDEITANFAGPFAFAAPSGYGTF